MYDRNNPNRYTEINFKEKKTSINDLGDNTISNHNPETPGQK